MIRDFKYIPLFFLAIIILLPIGFNRYINQLFGSGSSDTIVHFHTVTMTIWCFLLLLQPILILKRKYQAHRMIGKFTFFFIPILLIAMYLTIGLSAEYGVAAETAENMFMPFAHMVIFGTFYLLAMINKSNSNIHIRYIIISSMSLFGPTIGRIDLGFLSDINGGFELLFIDIVLVAFLLLDLSKKRNIKPFALGLGAYFFVHVGSLTFAYSTQWQQVVEFLYY